MVKRLIPHLGKPVNGFYTQEIRQPSGAQGKGRRLGFELFALDGRRGTLAHVDPEQVSGKTNPHIGRYSVSLRTLETLAASSLNMAVVQGSWAVIDEIGPMELLSESFRQAADSLLVSKTNVLGTIVQRSTPFGDQIKSRSDITLIELTPQNRDEVYNHLCTLIGK